jgi:hypothetical protein
MAKSNTSFTSETASEAGKTSKRKSARVVLNTTTDIENLLDDIIDCKYSDSLRDDILKMLVADAISERRIDRERKHNEQILLCKAYTKLLSRDEIEGLIENEDSNET